MVALMEACLGERSAFQHSENNELPGVGSAISEKPFSSCSSYQPNYTVPFKQGSGYKRGAGNAQQSSLSLRITKQTVPSST